MNYWTFFLGSKLFLNLNLFYFVCMFKEQQSEFNSNLKNRLVQALLAEQDDFDSNEDSDERINKRMTYRYGKRMAYRYGKRNAMPYRFGRETSDEVTAQDLLEYLRTKQRNKKMAMPYRFGKSLD